MKKRILLLLIAISLIITALPAASYAAASKQSIDAKAVCYTPKNDYKSGDCILTATKVMIRRASIMRGSKEWNKITNKTLRTPATIVGLLLHNFKFEADGLSYRVRVGFFSGTTEKARIKEFSKLIKTHPEGVVVWGSNSSKFGMHGVLLTDVKDGVPYVMDSAYNIGTVKKGILKWTDSSMKSPLKCTQYWVITEISLAKKAKAPAKGKPLAPISATDVETESTLAIKSPTIPSTITEGNGYPVNGSVNSNYRLSNVEVSIIDANGNAVISKSANPKDWAYDLGKLDSSIKFGTLSPGKYTYKISATDEKKSLVLVNSKFTVKAKPKTAATSTLAVKNASKPDTINQGSGFPITGTVSSNKKITSVIISVDDEGGAAVLTASATPDAKTYNLAKLDAKIRFGLLEPGTYRYTVTATDAAKTKKLINKQFTVVRSNGSSTLTIVSFNAPSSIKKGKAYSIKGKVKSNKTLKQVTVQVVDDSGSVKLSAGAKPKAKTYNIKKLDDKIKFGKLAKGSYRYKVIATDTAQTLVLIDNAFTVK